MKTSDLLLTRRSLLKCSLMASAAPVLASLLPACSNRQPVDLALQPADANGVRLPQGFRSRVLARSGRTPVDGSRFVWHPAPDGGACLAVSDSDGDGWIYVNNSEMSDGQGGAGALRFDAGGELIDAYSILSNTSRNCAGGLTPWGTWLSCEETPTGQVWECDPLGVRPAEVRPAMGRCKHEAVAVDAARRQLYLTEDRPDGGFYRFTPAAYPDLGSGLLEVAVTVERKAGGIQLGWAALSDPDAHSSELRYQQAQTCAFNGGEGIVYHAGKVYFTTKGDNVVWEYDIASRFVRQVYAAANHAEPVLTGVDNITADAVGNLYVAEDGGNMQVVMLDRNGGIAPLLELPGHPASEITGVAFSPDGTRLYFNSQRGESGQSADGMTFEIEGPFAAL